MTRRRSFALLLALIAVAIAATLAYSFLAAQSTTIAIARNIEHHSKARYVTESGLELAIAYIRANDDWRSEQSHGTWVTDEAFGDGTFTIVGEDGQDTDGDGTVDGDGDLSDDADDLLTLTVTGKVNGTSHVVRAVLTPEGGTGLIGHWKFDDGTGSTIASDSSGNDNHGTLTNMDPPTDWVAGQVGGALEFDGNNDYVDIGTVNFATGAHSVTLWAYSSSEDWETFFELQLDSLGIISYKSASEQVMCGHRGNVQPYTGSGTFTLNQWNHIALVYDGGDKSSSSSYKIYINGVNEATTTPYGVIGCCYERNYIGRERNAYGNSIIDDVRIYSRVLSADEVAALAGGGGSQLVLRPSGVGSSTALVGTGSGSGNWDRVNEETADGNTTYVASSGGSSYETDTYATQDSGISSGSISSVTINIRVCKGSGGSKVKTVLRTGGADYLGAQINLNSTTYSDYSTAYTTNPATSAAWTWAEIDAMEIGVTSRKGARCTQIYADVQYTDGGGGGGDGSYTYTVQWQEVP